MLPLALGAGATAITLGGLSLLGGSFSVGVAAAMPLLCALGAGWALQLQGRFDAAPATRGRERCASAARLRRAPDLAGFDGTFVRRPGRDRPGRVARARPHRRGGRDRRASRAGAADRADRAAAGARRARRRRTGEAGADRGPRRSRAASRPPPDALSPARGAGDGRPARTRTESPSGRRGHRLRTRVAAIPRAIGCGPWRRRRCRCRPARACHADRAGRRGAPPMPGPAAS